MQLFITNNSQQLKKRTCFQSNVLCLWDQWAENVLNILWCYTVRLIGFRKNYPVSSTLSGRCSSSSFSTGLAKLKQYINHISGQGLDLHGARISDLIHLKNYYLLTKAEEMTSQSAIIGAQMGERVRVVGWNYLYFS